MPQNIKTNLQKLILRLVYGKKTANMDSLVQELELLLDQEEEGRQRKTKPKYLINRTIKTMEQSGFLETFDTPHTAFARITPQGRQKLRTMKLDEDASPIPTTWDGMWRIVILDIPEEEKSQRNALRYILKKAQFACLKNSIWISPFPFEHMLTNMKNDLGLRDEILVIVTDQLDPQTQEYFFERYARG